VSEPEWVTLESRKGRGGTGIRMKKLVDIVALSLIAFVSVVILARALPYPLIKDLRFPFMNLEPSMYAVAILFMISRRLAFETAPERFFVTPIDTSGGANRIYLKADYAICGFIFVFSLIYHLILYDKGVPYLDEGFILALSDRVLHGEIPHRDFFLRMSPGAIYFNALIFRVFGATILVERTLTLVLASVTASIFYLLARIRLSFFFSIAATLLLLGWQFPFWFQASYSWYAMSLSMIGFLAMGLTRVGRARNRSTVLLVGFLCGMSFICKQNTGLFALAGIAVYMYAEKKLFRSHGDDRLSPCSSNAGRRDQGASHLARDLAALALGFIIPPALLTYPYLSGGCLKEYVEGIFLLKTHKGLVTPYMAFSRFTDKRIMAYLPFLMIILTSAVLLDKIRRGSLSSVDRFPLLLLLAMLANLLTVYPRADFIHIIFTLWPSLIMLAYWIQQGVIRVSADFADITKSMSISWKAKVILRNWIVILLSSTVFVVFLVHRTELNLLPDRDLVEIQAEKGKGIYGKRNTVEELNESLRFIGEYPGCDRPGAIFSTGPLIHYLSEILNTTRYDYILLPDNVSSHFPSDIISDFEQARPVLVVLDTANISLLASSPWEAVERYLLENYEPAFISSQSRYRILERKGALPRVGQARGKREKTDRELAREVRRTNASRPEGAGAAINLDAAFRRPGGHASDRAANINLKTARQE